MQVTVDQHRRHQAGLRGQAVSPEALPHFDAERCGVGREAQHGHDGAERGGLDHAVRGANLIVQDRSRRDSREEDGALGFSAYLACPTIVGGVQRPGCERTDGQPPIGLRPRAT